MRFLFIDPESLSFRGDQEEINVSIGLGYLTAVLKSQGHEVRVLHMKLANGETIQQKEERTIREFQPHMVGYQMFYSSYYWVKNSVTRIRRYYDGHIAVGGAQVGIERERLLEDIPQIDFAVVGEAENAIIQLANALSGKSDYSVVDGLIYRSQGAVRSNPVSSTPCDITRLPFPDYSGYNIKRITNYPLMTSRGCPYGCSFCYRHGGRVYRMREVLSVIEELILARELYGVEIFNILDDNFNMKPARVMQFCELLMERGIRLPWLASGIRADHVSDELISKMQEAGCQQVSMGVESLVPDVFARIGKGETLDDIRKAASILNRHGMKFLAFFIIGLPGDTYGGVMHTYEEACRIGIKNGQQVWILMFPMPRTRAYEELAASQGTKWLADYRMLNMIYGQISFIGKMQCTFETPEFPSLDKLKAFYKLSIKNGVIPARIDRGIFYFLLDGAVLLLKHDTHRFPINFLRWIFSKRMLGALFMKLRGGKNPFGCGMQMRNREYS
jgi:radical SAM superfamily enzyme YgiQ (UPF0313 family)